MLMGSKVVSHVRLGDYTPKTKSSAGKQEEETLLIEGGIF